MVIMTGNSSIATDPIIRQLVAHINRLETELKQTREEVERLNKTSRQPLKIDARPLNMQFRSVTTSQPP